MSALELSPPLQKFEIVARKITFPEIGLREKALQTNSYEWLSLVVREIHSSQSGGFILRSFLLGKGGINGAHIQ